MQEMWADAIQVEATGRFVPVKRERFTNVSSVRLVSLVSFATAAEAIAFGSDVMGICNWTPGQVH